MAKPTTTIRVLLTDHAYMKAYIDKHGGNILGLVMQMVLLHRESTRRIQKGK